MEEREILTHQKIFCEINSFRYITKPVALTEKSVRDTEWKFANFFPHDLTIFLQKFRQINFFTK